MAIVEITEDNFSALVEGADGQVLLDFWAPWCGYCRMLEPVLTELDGDLSASGRKVLIGRINTDEQTGLAERFGIDALPTLMTFKNGRPAKVEQGFRPKAALAAMLD